MGSSSSADSENLKRASLDERSLFLDPRLLRGNGPHEDAEDRLRNKVRHRVANLLVGRGFGSGQAHTLEDVDERVCEPR